MEDAYDPYKRPKDLGKESPASGEAKEQSISGTRGGPQQSRPRGTPKQPAQTSGRRSKRHEQAPKARKSFAPDEDPSEQGEGEPSAETIKKRSDQQGIDAR